MRAVVLAMVAALVPGMAGAGAMDDLLSEQMVCASRPAASAVLYKLQSEGLIGKKPTTVADSLNYFRVKRPLTVYGLPAVAVLGFDSTGTFKFVRSPGTAPGISVLGFTTTASKAAVDRWVSANGSKALSADEPSNMGGGLIDVSCNP